MLYKNQSIRLFTATEHWFLLTLEQPACSQLNLYSVVDNVNTEKPPSAQAQVSKSKHNTTGIITPTELMI